ncbi:hypothetical protein [Hymenobacter guriensis]|uniref:Uncharacterized protein n=1 Tax=Hymenobacter guriensis TaxID=2793065 RepID=A0ABS0L940_9BACT|nr:hypothetical protein [Hymenobacter guriensis]MBG8556004.1 hypothetical protein [Hymenobacter guriensis]
MTARPAAAQRPLDSLYHLAQAGSRPALERLVRLTRSHKQVQYLIGRHRRKSSLGTLAAGNLRDLVRFTAGESKGGASDFSRTHLTLVRTQLPKLRYYPLYQQWGLSALETDSGTVYHLRNPSVSSIVLKPKSMPDLLFHQPGSAQLDSLWQANSPLVLRELPRYMYVRRHQGFVWTQDIVKFMEQATGLQVGVQNYRADTVYSLAYDYYDVALRNYTVFWARHYQEFHWNQHLARFEAPALAVHTRAPVQQLLDQIASPDSSVAFRAYTTFIEQDIQLPWAYRGLAGSESVPNQSLPTFWERFVAGKQALRSYLLTTGLPLNLPPILAAQSRQLLLPLPFGQRYRLENQIIQALTPETVTAFELLMLDYEQNKPAQESVGRILDVLYSRHWPRIMTDKTLLALYLKKVRVYNALGIVGSSRYVVFKLDKLNGPVRRAIRAVRATTPDADVREIARTVLRPHWRYESRRTFNLVRASSRPAVAYNPDSLRQLLQEQGLALYTAGKLDLARADTALKYDAPLGFVGGYSPRTTTLEPLIRLLETEFRTDLGFGPAFGDWRVSQSASVVHRARAWRRYLRQQGLVARDTAPISFVQENDFHSRTKHSPLKRKLKLLWYRLKH